MKSKIIIAAVAMVFLAGGAFLITNKASDDGLGTKASTQSANGNTEERSSINGLLAQGKNVQCAYSYTDGNSNKSSGTVYIAGERMRGNFTVKASGQAAQTSNMLRDDQYQYVWTEDTDTGFKIKISELDANDQKSTDEQNQQSVDQDKKYDFDCSGWSVDESMFKVPGGIKFTDYSAQVKQSQNAAKEAEKAKQDACAKIDDASVRAACESAQ